MARDDDRDRTRSRLGALTRPVERSHGEVGSGDLTDNEGFTGDDSPDWLSEPTTVRPSRVPERWRGARINPGRRGAATLLLVGLIAAVAAGVFAIRARPVAQPVPPLSGVSIEAAAAPTSVPASAPSSQPATEKNELVVSVVGLVNNSGLVRLPPGSRIADAIAAAGGAKEGADLLSLNMAQRVADADQILVGVANPGGGNPLLGSAAVSAGGSGGTNAGPAAAGPGKVDLNTASEQELDTLPGVGPVTAAAIVSWRTAHGPFTDVEQLGDVDGIGPARL
ncbi:MAG: helix-hairpin-helix domain-containing protein, partial [Aldersonia sp.]|nr:helix-hairpin-helix domain-containing protein [Aldersonia sp.]